MRALVLACLASLLAYVLAFALVLDRPLGIGFLRAEIETRLARGAAAGSPKLVILAGSNGPYSHRCQVIAPILGMDCVNGGVAVGIGLDYLFARWQALLAAGDVVYLPMEFAQYTRGRAAIRVGPDAAIMLRHDRATLAGLPPDRWLGAVFAFDLRALVLSLVEPLFAAGAVTTLRAGVVGQSNGWGDHVGHGLALAEANRSVLAASEREEPAAAAIEGGEGGRQIGAFVAWATAHGVVAIGGPPTGFDDVVLPEPSLAAVRHIYEAAGGRFLSLANRGRYPRAAFFDTPDHLNEPCQTAHSIVLAQALAALLGRRPGPVPEAALAMAAACPIPARVVAATVP